MTALKLNSVSKSYNSLAVLAPLDLEIKQGEFLALVGPSGCGKSTLLKIMAGLETADAGTIEQNLSRRGVVFQEASLLPWRDTRGNVELPLEFAGLPRAQRRAEALAMLERLGLAGFERARPHQLSGGMAMRVALARALVTSPELLLLDEPFAALDEFTRMRLQQELLGLYEAEKTTVVFVTHNLFEAVFLASRILVFSARPGRILTEFAVPEPYPRSGRWRTASELNRIVTEALAALELA